MNSFVCLVRKIVISGNSILYKDLSLITFHIFAEDSDNNENNSENSDDGDEEIDENTYHVVSDYDVTEDPSNDLPESPRLEWEKYPRLRRKYSKQFPCTDNADIQVDVTHNVYLQI